MNRDNDKEVIGALLAAVVILSILLLIGIFG